MIPVVWINCSFVPFLDLIGTLDKRLETRTRNTLKRLVGLRVILAETGHGLHLARYSVVIRSVRAVRSWEEWDALRHLHRVPVGSKYDWKPDTKVKYLYELANLRRLRPFTVPEGIRHGYTWMEYKQNGGKRNVTF